MSFARLCFLVRGGKKGWLHMVLTSKCRMLSYEGVLSAFLDECDNSNYLVDGQHSCFNNNREQGNEAVTKIAKQCVAPIQS